MRPWVLLIFPSFALANFCPFPGIPKNGYGVNFHNNSEQFQNFFNWNVRQCFEEGEVIQFTCEEGWATSLSEQSEAIKCKSDGTWNATLPKCENIIDLTDWEKKSVTLYKDKIEEEIINSTKCNIHFSIARLTPNNSIRVSDIREVHVKLCHERKIMLTISSEYSWDNTSCTAIHEKQNKTTFSCNFANSMSIGNEQLNVIDITMVDNQFSLKNVTLLVRSDDYCGFPAVPVNGTVKMINATEYEYSCYNGSEYSGAHRSTCDPKTGQWNPPPTCSSNISLAYIFGAAGAIIALIFLVLVIILLIKRHRSHQSTSAEPVQQDPANDCGAPEPNIYQNIILLTVNEQPIYTKVEFDQNYPIYSVINDDGQQTPEVIYSTVVVPAAINSRE